MTAGHTVERRYRFGPRTLLAVTGHQQARRHFEREYAEAAVVGGAPDVLVDVRCGGPPLVGGGAVTRGRHKTVSWEMCAHDPTLTHLTACIRVRGRPRAFALSLVQGYFVEPLVALACARAGVIAVPSAGFCNGREVVVLMGRSGSGKSSVTARALAAGRSVLGDDQILLDRTGQCWRYPRRLRVYSDLPRTAPGAYARLPRQTKAALLARKLAKAASRGFVAPSLPVPRAALGQPAPTEPLPLRRLVVIERMPAAHMTDEARNVEWASDCALALLEEQRAKLLGHDGAEWQEAWAAAREQERDILRAALADVEIQRVAVPSAWDAPRAIGALAEHVGAERG